jgi:hypothetical protein
MPKKDKATKTETCVCQSNFSDVLFTLMEEMEKQSSGILTIAKDKALDDIEGSRTLMTIGGVVGMLAESLKATLEKSK